MSDKNPKHPLKKKQGKVKHDKKKHIYEYQILYHSCKKLEQIDIFS